MTAQDWITFSLVLLAAGALVRHLFKPKCSGCTVPRTIIHDSRSTTRRMVS